MIDALKKFKVELKKTVRYAWHCIRYSMPGNRLKLVNLTREIKSLHGGLIDYCKIVDRTDLIEKWEQIGLSNLSVADLKLIKKNILKDFIDLLQSEL